ncbi:MAG: dapA [Acidimicrobiales bacterium]|jgi:4-hydroxy-tetrahydrodipicolinate synthase|nr:dapA [Acidimicrobiales bacterium]
MARFGEVMTAMVTPFDSDGALDLDAAAALARWLVEQGNDGLVVAGSTGEGSTLTDREKLDLFGVVAGAVPVPVIAATGSNDTAHSVELTRQAAATGVAGVLVVTPYYNRPSQAGLDAHFRAVAAATELPMLIYDIPIRSGRKIAHDVFVGLARDVTNVVGAKDAAADVSASARLAADAPSSFEIYSGNDDQTLPLLSVGAVGVVGVATHWCAAEMAELIASYRKGDVDHARDVNAKLLPSYDFETGDAAPNPLPAKAMMRVMGHAVGQCRLPMGDAPAGLEDRAREVLNGLRG